MERAITGKTIVLGVSGGIAAYKAISVASQLVQAGARVEPVLTLAALKFVQPLTFSAITQTDVHTDPFAAWSEGFLGHISLAENADLVILAPATASTIARLAIGLADDLLQLVCLSTSAPILVAPAMEHQMFQHSATQSHLETLRMRGVNFVGPDRGRLASGAEGEGRLATPEAIVETASWLLGRDGPLAGSTVVVSAGGTREPIDPVRYIGNRSSGEMGYAIARAALQAGAKVTLVTGPVALNAPRHARVIAVETALEMQAAIGRAVQDADVLIMAAAVADFRPDTVSERKIKKVAGVDHVELKLTRNPDILASLDDFAGVRIGFAAETDDLLGNARGKLTTKNLDAIIANDAVSTIGAQDSKATIVTRGGQLTTLPRMAKSDLAWEIVQLAAQLLHDKRGFTS